MNATDRIILKCFLSLLLLVLIAGVVTAENPQTLKAKINSNLDNYTPVFVYFYSDYCHFCQEQSPIVNILEEDYSGNITFIYVNLDENPTAGLDFNVRNVPVTLLITDRDPTQQFVYREFRGLKNSTVLSNSIEQAVANISIPSQTVPQTHHATSGTVILTLIIILTGITALLRYIIRY